MSLIPPLLDAQATDPAKGVFQNLQKAMGVVPNIFRTMGHAPEVLQATLGLNSAIQRELPPRLRELAYVKTSELNGCNYCLHYHRTFGKKAGLSDEQLQAVANYAGSSTFNDLEKAVLRFAEEWTLQGRASRAVVERLAKDLTPPQMVVLAATVGLANWTNRYNETFGLELP